MKKSVKSFLTLSCDKVLASLGGGIFLVTCFLLGVIQEPQKIIQPILEADLMWYENQTAQNDMKTLPHAATAIVPVVHVLGDKAIFLFLSGILSLLSDLDVTTDVVFEG